MGQRGQGRGGAVGGVSPGRVRRIGLLAAGAAVAVWAGLHASSVGASWSSAWQLIAGLRWQWLVGLGVVWFAGLCVHTVVLTAAMPGLSHRRALTLNLSGSAVANVLPLGGVAGTALNLGMVRSWGHSGRDFARFFVVSKASDLIAKLLTPLVAVAALVLWDVVAPGRHSALWLVGGVVSAVAGALVMTAVAGRAGPLLRVVTLAERLLGRGGRRRGPRPVLGWTATVTELLAGTDRLVRRRWAALSGGMAGYWLSQGALLWLCTMLVGLRLPVPVIFAGLVMERLLTLAAITPGGAGLVETGTIAVLISLGADPSRALAGVLLYRAFVFLAEIPVGGLALVAWLFTRRTAIRRRPSQAGDEHPSLEVTSRAYRPCH
ncbi:lysylphosphatidylglycerol synthase transmembrane domain-containing protein [Dactylosporangium sp. CA-092794]|uniref:lysylphosphatidylglycerol synthase transmembrane domain-containing protein n=1 Tax=Dactylosporangium sp. CA-092794 TaxID=3239929 RepID=UPI003D8B79D6